MQSERGVLALRNLALDVRDLVLGLLAVELDDARAAAFGVGFAGLLLVLGRFLVFRALDRWVDVGVLVPRGVVGGDDGVPDYGFGGWDGGGRGGGVGGGDVEEDLLGVPVEEGSEVCELR